MAWGVPKIGTATTVASGNVALTEPASSADGDLMIICIAARGNAAFTVPGTWNLVATAQNSGDTDATNGIASGVMMWRVRSGSANITINRTAGDVAIGVMLSYTGGHASAPYDTGSSNTLAVASGTVTTGTFNTAQAGELIVAMTAAGDTLTASTFFATDPSGASGATDTSTAPVTGSWRERVDTTTGTGADTGLAVADAVRGTAGATGTIQATISASARHVMIAGAFKLGSSSPTLDCDPAAVTVTGQTVALERDLQLPVTQASVTVTGQDVTLSKGYTLNVDPATITVTGQDVTFERDLQLPVTQASVAVTGQTVALERDLILVADPASVTVTGSTVSLDKGYLLDVTAASIAVTGQDVTLERDLQLPVTAASVTVTGQDVALERDLQLPVAQASVSVTGQDVALERDLQLPVTQAAITVTGSTVDLDYQQNSESYTLNVDPASIAVTGSDVAFIRSYSLTVEPASVSVTGSNVDFIRALQFLAEAGAVTVSGSTVTLTYTPTAVYSEPYYLTIHDGKTRLTISDGEGNLTLNTGNNYLDLEALN